MPFCKMCFDLGRPDFNNHNVRDTSRNTTCPYLINTKCRNCSCYGHTSNYCNMPQKFNYSNYSSPAPNFRPYVQHIDIVKPIVKPKNVFEILNEYCSDEENDDADFKLPDIKDIRWGIGFISGSWADQADD